MYIFKHIVLVHNFFFFFGLDLTFCVSIAFSDSVSQTLNGMTLLSTWH